MTENPANPAGDFYPSRLMQRLISLWWVAALLIIAGGGIGFLISRVQQPLYESTSVITTAINFAYAGRLDDYEEDMLITAVGDVISSSQVMSRVVEESASSGIDLDEKTLADDLTKSRQGYRWELSSRFHDPNLAKQVNQIWLNAAMVGLEDLRITGIEGLDELAYQHAVESCFSQSVVVEPSSAYCGAEEMEQIRASVAKDSLSAEEKTLLTRLLISRISFEVTQQPSFPSEADRFRTNLTTLAGSAAGLIVAIIFLLSGYPRARQQEK